MSEQKAAVPDPTEIASRYVVERKLGAGAFGTVYKAKDKILGRMVAIKTIRLEGLAASGASLTELLKRFLREAQVSAQLKHPNIVTIYDIGEVGGMSYLAMEFIDGVGLEKVIREGALPVERAAAIAAQVADALDYAHKNNVVHRDIKPANIMLEAGDRVKVADFGIARVTNSADQLTATGGLLGTPSYMSPEQAKGNELDGRSDLFSVGCVLYEMLTGKRAFRGESITGLIFKVITEDPEPMKQLVPGLPAEIERIVAKAMYKAPDGRYQNGRELMEALQPFVAAAGTPTVRQIETPTEALPELGDALATAQVAPTMAAAPTRIAGAAAAVSPPPPASAGRAAATAPSVPRPARESPAPQTAQRRQGSSGLLLAMVGVGVLLLGGLLAGGWYYFSRKAGPATAELQATPEPRPTTAAAALPATTMPPSLATPAPEPSAEPATQPASRAPEATLPPPSLRPEPAGRRLGNERRAETNEAPPVEPATGGSFPHLDDESVAGGNDVIRRSGDYRSGGAGVYGDTRYRVKQKVPQGLMPQERPAVATILHLISAQEAYHDKHERYAALPDLVAARLALLDVKPSGNAFQRKGYRFSLVVEEDGFRVLAQPLGRMGRPFVGDDSGFVRIGLQ